MFFKKDKFKWQIKEINLLFCFAMNKKVFLIESIEIKHLLFKFKVKLNE